jgi:hypothetical protein
VKPTSGKAGRHGNPGKLHRADKGKEHGKTDKKEEKKAKRHRQPSPEAEDGHRRQEKSKHRRVPPPERGRSHREPRETTSSPTEKVAQGSRKNSPSPIRPPILSPSQPGEPSQELNFDIDDDELVNQVSERKKVKISKVRTWDEHVTLNGRTLRMKVDSGSTVCTLSWRDFTRLGLSEDILQPPKRKIVTYCKGKVEPLGEFEATIALRERSTRARVLLLEDHCTHLLSCAAGAELGLFTFHVSSAVECEELWEWDSSFDDVDAAEDEFLRPCQKTVAVVL